MKRGDLARIGRRRARAEQQLRLFELRQCRAQRRLVAACDRAQQRVREFAPDRGADLLRYLLVRRQPVRRAANESCNVAGMVKGGDGPSKRRSCDPATSRPPSSTAMVNSSTKSGTPSATTCYITSSGSGPPATRMALAGPRRPSAMLVPCDRPVQGASYSGRKVISANIGKARTRSTVRSSTPSDFASAQWTSSNSIKTGFCRASASSWSNKAARVGRHCCAALNASGG
jgi:hypothetical protein